MVKATEDKLTLLVRHLPESLSDDEKISLLKHFGAERVKVMGTKGRMKHTAFAVFASNMLAHNALSRLHQLEVLGQCLSVEFSKNNNHAFHPKIDEDYGQKHTKNKISQEESKSIPELSKGDVDELIANEINAMSSKWNVKYQINPKLKYFYPPPTVSILTNIGNALAAVPKFYVQVLHLMNKMNLPAPFGAITQTPPLAEDSPYVSDILTDPDLLEQQDMEVSSSTESEIESDDGGKKKASMPVPKPSKKRKSKHSSQVGPQLKFQKIMKNLVIPKGSTSTAKPEDVFEQPLAPKQKKEMEFKLVSGSVPDDSAIGKNTEVDSQSLDAVHPAEIETHSVLKMFLNVISKHRPVTSPKSDDILTDILNIVEMHYNPNQPGEGEDHQDEVLSTVMSLLEKYRGNVPDGSQVIRDLENVLSNFADVIPQQAVVGSFGKIDPPKKDVNEDEENSDNEVEEWGSGKFISTRRLRKGRISRSEMKSLNVFKNYSAGAPTSRLYIKNLNSKTTEQDLHYIFGRYVDWDDELDKNMFDIRLMKEGRMKGQAFVTLGKEVQSIQAVEDTNGFELNGKPMVVQFARSAKPKETEKNPKGQS